MQTTERTALALLFALAILLVFDFTLNHCSLLIALLKGLEA